MIKINLLPQKDVKRRRRSASVGGGGGGSGNNIVALFMLVLVMEVAGLMYWYTQAEAANQAFSDGTGEMQNEISRLKQVQAEMKEMGELEVAIGKQRIVFDALEFGKVGPINMLLFISYALRRVDATLPDEEYRVLTDKWASDQRRTPSVGAVEREWNPETVWLRVVREQKGAMIIEGDAKDHEDVMAFLRRLKTGIYFEGVDLVSQKVNDKSPLGQSYVEFKLRCEINYDPRGYPAL